jgi:glycosyltransferase involved in cell wall biosynthesis
MKVLILHNAYPHPGGEDTVVANEIAMLNRHGYEVVPCIVPTEESGILSLIRCGLSAVWNPFAYKRLKTLVKNEKPDIVHCHNAYPLLSPSVFAACHAAGVPVVQTVHNYRHICPAGGFFRDGHVCEKCLGKKFPYPIFIHRCYRNNWIASAVPAMATYVQRVRKTFERDVDAIIALNTFAKDKLTTGGLPAERIVIKPNFCPRSVARDLPPHSEDHPFTICFAGRLSIDKGVKVLLKAWTGFVESLPDVQKKNVRLLLAGGGELQPHVHETAALHPSIVCMGTLSHDATMEMIEQADCLVCPSIWFEGMPMTLLEAFSKGRPVISSAIGGLPDMVQHETNGLLFTPGDATQLQRCINTLHSSETLLRDMGKNALRIYEEYYSEEANFPLLEKIYRDTIHTFRTRSETPPN